MKILNLHGFMGEADNKNYKALCGFVSPNDIISPQLQYKEQAPNEMLASLSALVDAPDNFIFIGQSLGGWYADQLSRKYHRPCILTNPCYYPHELGLIRESNIPLDYLKQYEEQSSHECNERATVLCSDADTVLTNNYERCRKLARLVIAVCGSHSTIDGLPRILHDIWQKVGQ